MTTYEEVAAKALREFAESNGVYVATETAKAAIEAIFDALVEAGADAPMLIGFLTSASIPVVEDPWDSVRVPESNDSNADLLKQAAEILLKVAESL